MRTLKRLTEDELVAAIAQSVGVPPRRLVAGIGDDAAVWKMPSSHLSVITTDMLVDGVHFRAELTTPEALGHKALAVNLSDIAAMGATPKVAVVGLGVADVVDEDWARAFYRGMATLAQRHLCSIAGVDIVRSPALTIAVTVTGDVRRSGLRLRSGARPGDVACVTGPLGLAAAGLQCMGAAPDMLPSDAAAILRAAYETPTPRVDEGKFLGSSRAVHAMMDISDGISLDGARMAKASGVDLSFDFARLEAPAALRAFGERAAEFMVHGGDDYELLAAVDARAFRHLAARFRARFKRELTAIGRFESGDGKLWETESGAKREHAPRGYDHLTGP